MDRLNELHRLHIHSAHSLTLGLKTLLSDELLSIHDLSLPVFMLTSESDFELRMLVLADSHQV